MAGLAIASHRTPAPAALAGANPAAKRDGLPFIALAGIDPPLREAELFQTLNKRVERQEMAGIFTRCEIRLEQQGKIPATSVY
ncbi:MAG: hypothetical protein AB7R90_02080 [Reyranellaceae bacterium]